MNSKEIEMQKKKMRLTLKQKEILVGLMLGDGHLETQNNGKTFRLKIGHSISQAKYVDWLFEQFSDWVLTSPQTKQVVINGKTFVNYWFNTVSHASLRFYAQQFYCERKKVVPKMIGKLLTEQGLAIWFMDDGSFKSKEHRAVILNTQCFLKTDIEKLQKILVDKWHIESKLRKQSDGIQILFNKDSAIKFAKVISPYLLSEFNYKLGKIRLT